LLSAGEYRQLTGRAGRRGMDAVGYAVLLHSPWVGLDRMLEVATGEVAPLVSAFRPSYSTVLNLWQQPEDEERLAQLIAGSLGQFHHAGQIRSLVEEREALASALAGIHTGCPRDGGPVNWLAQEKTLKKEQERAESALNRAAKEADSLARGGKVEAAKAAQERATVARERLKQASQAAAQTPLAGPAPCGLRTAGRSGRGRATPDCSSRWRGSWRLYGVSRGAGPGRPCERCARSWRASAIW